MTIPARTFLRRVGGGEAVCQVPKLIQHQAGHSIGQDLRTKRGQRPLGLRSGASSLSHTVGLANECVSVCVCAAVFPQDISWNQASEEHIRASTDRMAGAQPRGSSTRAAKASHPSPLSGGNPGPGRQGHLPPSLCGLEPAATLPQEIGLPDWSPQSEEARTALQGPLRKERESEGKPYLSTSLPRQQSTCACYLHI